MLEKNHSDFPQFICIGAQKAGTTWLADALASHPDLWNPGIKEIHFFDRLSIETNSLNKKSATRLLTKLRQIHDQGHKEIPKELVARSKEIFSLDDYRTLFSNRPSGRISWEITPAYASMPESNVHYMTNLLPECKYLFIIRSPYERAVSQWRMVISRKFKDIAVNETRLTEEFYNWIKNDSLNRGNYSSIIKTYAKHIDLEKYFLFLPFGELKVNPKSFLSKIYNYLGVSEYYPKEPNKASHITKKHILSDYMHEKLQQLTEKQNDFIKDFFGETFAQDCR